MSRTPANWPLKCVKGATWEGDYFQYTDAAEVPINLTGYQARMQVRQEAGRFGLSTTTTLILELTTLNGLLKWNTAATGRVDIEVSAAQVASALNPKNLKKVRYAYALEVYRPEDVGAGEPEYVIPLVEGSLTVYGRGIRQ